MTRAQDVLSLARSILDSPRFIHACTIAIVGTAFLADTLQRLIGWPGMIAIVATLLLLAVGTFVVRRAEIAWLAVLPVSLLLFVGWSGLSVLWSSYRSATVGGVAYLVAFTVLALYVALLRDTIQIVRSFGDVLRLVLALSLSIEILSGVLIDTALPFLAVEGNLASLGPIQGMLATRNQMGIVALLAIITFSIELSTRSVSRGLAVGSLALGILCLLLSRSPVAFGALAAVGIAVAALALTRRVASSRRVIVLWATLIAATVLVVLAWILRSPIIALLSANSELSYRLSLWRGIWGLIALNPLEGWGWVGPWRPELQPFTLFAGAREPTSAVNAYVDVWFQLGLAGVFIFVVLVALAFTRSWLLAGRQRSIVFAWPALVLVLLIVTSLAESSILVDYGWLTFVVCCVKAAKDLSWRGAFTRARDDEIDA